MVTLPELLCIWVFSTCAAEKTERKNPIQIRKFHCWPNIKLAEIPSMNGSSHEAYLLWFEKQLCVQDASVVWLMNVRMIANPNRHVHTTQDWLSLQDPLSFWFAINKEGGNGRELFEARFKNKDINAMTIEYKSRDVYSTHDWIHDRNELVVQHPDYYQSKAYQPMLGCASWKIVNHNESLICSNEYKFIWNTIYFKHLQDLATMLSSIMTTLTTCSSNICPCQSDSDDSSEPPPSDWRVRSQWQQRFLLPIAASIIPKV